MTGRFVPALSAAPRIAGPAAVVARAVPSVLRKSRRDAEGVAMGRILARLPGTVKGGMPVVVSEYRPPCGPLAIAARGDVLVSIHLEGRPERLAKEWARREPVERGRLTPALTRSFDAYFNGDIRAIDALEADPDGTEFQRSVWAELRRIHAGTTISYSQLAARIGRPDAVPAAATATGANPGP